MRNFYSKLPQNTLLVVAFFFLSLSLVSFVYSQDTPNLVGTVRIIETKTDEKEPIDEIIVSRERIPERVVIELEAEKEPETDVDEIEDPQDERLIEEETSTPIIAGVKWRRDSVIKIPSFEENIEYNIATPNSLLITHGPSDIDIKSSNFIAIDNVWILASQPGKDQVKWEFSKNNVDWVCCSTADIAKIFDLNVSKNSAHNFYFRLKTPTETSSYSPHGTTITIIVSEACKKVAN